MLKRALIPIALLLGLSQPAVADDAGVGSGAGSGAAAEVAAPQQPAKPAPADAVTNPAQHPQQAWDDAKAAKKVGWPLLIWISLVMIGKALAYGRDKLANVPVLGGAAKLLAKGKGAMLLAAIGAVGAAGYAALLDGGSLVAALVASGAALGGVMHSTTQPPKTTGGQAPSTS